MLLALNVGMPMATADLRLSVRLSISIDSQLGWV